MRLDNSLLHVRAADADVPTVPTAAERVVAPVAEGGIANVRRIAEPMNEAELAIDLVDHRLGCLVLEPWILRGGTIRGRIRILGSGDLVPGLPGLTAARAQSVPEADIGAVVVACHEHRGTLDG